MLRGELPHRKVKGVLLLLFNVSLALCGLVGTYLTVTLFNGKTSEYSLFDVWWADDAADILKAVGIDRIYYGLTVARTGAIIAFLSTLIAFLLSLLKLLFNVLYPTSVALFFCLIVCIVSSAVVCLVWSEEFPEENFNRVLSLRYGIGFYAELLLFGMAMLESMYLCYIFHWVERRYHDVIVQDIQSEDAFHYVAF